MKGEYMKPTLISMTGKNRFLKAVRSFVFYGTILALPACCSCPPCEDQEIPVSPPTAHNLNYRWVLPSGSPDIDGTTVKDMGWASSIRYVADNGSSSPDTVIQAKKDKTNVYLSFEITGDVTLDNWDAIAIG